jgi:hypothetical protein
MSSEHFRGLCRDMLSGDDLALLDYCALDPDAVLRKGSAGQPYGDLPPGTDSSFIDGWYAFERALRLHLARNRSQALKRESAAPTEPPAAPADAENAAKAALALESPLEAELLLGKARWDVIDSLQGLNYFGRNTVYAYLLKLLLIERRQAFKAEEGFAEYKALYASIMEAGAGETAFAGGASTSTESGEP